MENNSEIKPKDYFSAHAKLYAAFRPTYPEELYNFIFTHVVKKDIVWDCATGNGQVANYLSDHFRKVFATDISQQQVDNATKVQNIVYAVGLAEKTSFPDNRFDLITVAQAIHWFQLEEFYTEVKRVSKSGGIIAVWGYHIPSVTPEIDTIIFDFYHQVVGPYWDSARKLVEDSYVSIPFPFEEILTPAFQSKFTWTPGQLEGYLTTWSSTQKYIRDNNSNPVPRLIKNLLPYWQPATQREVHFPIFLRLGKVMK